MIEAVLPLTLEKIAEWLLRTSKQSLNCRASIAQLNVSFWPLLFRHVLLCILHVRALPRQEIAGTPGWKRLGGMETEIQSGVETRNRSMSEARVWFLTLTLLAVASTLGTKPGMARVTLALIGTHLLMTGFDKFYQWFRWFLVQFDLLSWPLVLILKKYYGDTVLPIPIL